MTDHTQFVKRVVEEVWAGLDNAPGSLTWREWENRTGQKADDLRMACRVRWADVARRLDEESGPISERELTEEDVILAADVEWGEQIENDSKDEAHREHLANLHRRLGMEIERCDVREQDFYIRLIEQTLTEILAGRTMTMEAACSAIGPKEENRR